MGVDEFGMATCRKCEEPYDPADAGGRDMCVRCQVNSARDQMAQIVDAFDGNYEEALQVLSLEEAVRKLTLRHLD